MMEHHLAQLWNLTQELNLTMVFVGSVPLDALTIQMHPAKHDWGSFNDFSLPVIWDGVEAELFQRLPRTYSHGPQASLLHFRPTTLALECPGVRCDGMHFGSGFSEFGCSSSVGLWQAPLASFLLENFGPKGGDQHYSAVV